ncbi:DUF3592 domain-containing protein [Tenacibaculum sp. S7007]|uniref:DUF3592 domain-containing protein n=1 Tax=Tenacibaculum pelagium TaxID=2759527 RepID=A0A839AQ00_9FLAO|nr:DUF3592 domain-containing protein [Tenacibaculum pelagium]MBA6156224.1 DUF3592 domain-containing protein [Tenacibaculum pelagium]
MIFIYIGLALFILGFLLILIDNNAKNWEETYGYIIKSELNQSYEHNIEEGGGYYTYEANIVYEYFIPKTNHKYESSKIFPVGGSLRSTNKQEHLSIKNKLTLGKKVIVYYNPYNHKKACLVVGKNFHLKILLFLGLTIMGIAAGIQIKETGQNPEKTFIDKIEVIK